MSKETIRTFIARPVEIKAIQYDGTNYKECEAFGGKGDLIDEIHIQEGDFIYKNGEGSQVAEEGLFLDCYREVK